MAISFQTDAGYKVEVEIYFQGSPSQRREFAQISESFDKLEVQVFESQPKSDGRKWQEEFWFTGVDFNLALKKDIYGDEEIDLEKSWVDLRNADSVTYANPKGGKEEDFWRHVKHVKIEGGALKELFLYFSKSENKNLREVHEVQH